MECLRILQNLDNGKLPLNRVMTKQTRQSLKFYAVGSLVPLARKGLNNGGREHVLQRKGVYCLFSASGLKVSPFQIFIVLAGSQ